MLLVIGATGNIGRHLVPDLVARGEKVRVVSRRAGHVPDVLGREVAEVLEVVEGDVRDRNLLAAALDGVERAFVTLPGSADQAELEAGVYEAAARAGLRQLVKISVIGPAEDHVVPYARYQFEAERALAASGVPATIVRPNWFAENFLGSAPTIAGQGAVYGSAGDGRVAFVDSRDTAAVTAHVLTTPGHEGREYVVTGPESLTFAEAAARIGEGLGRQVTYVDLDDDAFAAALTQAGLPPEVGAAVVAINRNARRGALAGVSSTVPDLLGRPATPLARWASDNAGAFSG